MTDFIKLQGIFENGYGFIAKKVMKDKRLDIYSKAIYSYICSYTGKGSDAFPSQKLICADLGISKDTLYKYLKQLKELGYITTKQENGNKGKFTNTIYTVNLVPCMVSSDTVTTETDTAVYGEQYPNNNSISNNNSNINNNNTKKVCVENSEITDKQAEYRNKVESKKLIIKDLITLNRLNLNIDKITEACKGNFDLVIQNIKTVCQNRSKFVNLEGAIISSIKDGGYEIKLKQDKTLKSEFEFNQERFDRIVKIVEVADVSALTNKDRDYYNKCQEYLRG